MTKITLPEPVKCWKCRGTTFIHDPDRDDPIPCDCKTGFRYDFDAVAAAVRKAGYLPLIRGAKYSDDYIAAVISVGGGPLKIELVESEETGPTPTAALVVAAVKVNEGG